MLWVARPSRPVPIADGKRRNSSCRRWRGRSPSAVSHADRHAVIAYSQPNVAAPVGRCCAAGRLLTLRGRGGWFLQADGVLHTRQEVQRATASTTSVHRPPDPDRRACLLAFPWAGKCGSRGQEEDRRRHDLLQSRCSASAFVMCVLIEAYDEWQVSDRRYLSETSMALLTPPEPTALPTR